MSVSAHPAGLSRGITHYNRVGRNFFGYDGAGANKGIFTYLISAYYGGIGANAGALSYDGLPVFILPGDGTPWIEHIGEYHGGTKKYIIFTSDACVYRNVILYLNIVSQGDLGRNNDVLPDVAVIADYATGHDMGEMPDFSTLADGATFINYCRGMCGKAHSLVNVFSADRALLRAV